MNRELEARIQTILDAAAYGMSEAELDEYAKNESDWNVYSSIDVPKINRKMLKQVIEYLKTYDVSDHFIENITRGANYGTGADFYEMLGLKRISMYTIDEVKEIIKGHDIEDSFMERLKRPKDRMPDYVYTEAGYNPEDKNLPELIYCIPIDNPKEIWALQGAVYNNKKDIDIIINACEQFLFRLTAENGMINSLIISYLKSGNAGSGFVKILLKKIKDSEYADDFAEIFDEKTRKFTLNELNTDNRLHDNRFCEMQFIDAWHYVPEYPSNDGDASEYVEWTEYVDRFLDELNKICSERSYIDKITAKLETYVNKSE
jgi:hypothetical protein